MLFKHSKIETKTEYLCISPYFIVWVFVGLSFSLSLWIWNESTTEIHSHSKNLFLFWILFKSQIQARQLSFPQFPVPFLSNLGSAEWPLQRRVVRRRAVLPSATWWPENTTSACTSTEWASRSFPGDTQWNLEIFPEGDRDSRCAHWYQAQQSQLGHKNKECSVSYLCTLA